MLTVLDKRIKFNAFNTSVQKVVIYDVYKPCFRVASIINPLNEKMITFKDFIYSFQATFCLQDFLADAQKKFTHFQSTHSDFASESVEITNSQNASENKFLQILLENNGCKPAKVISTVWPTTEVLVKICSNQVFDSFEDFEKTCAESEDITLMIGRLPLQSVFHKQEEISTNDESSQQKTTVGSLPKLHPPLSSLQYSQQEAAELDQRVNSLRQLRSKSALNLQKHVE
ncbi:uncharacterized protein LOC106464490 isoform X2 [Limulus polyphemus]|uniref:Uncharacterized protein LOC106464490 isoform X2 n=1 Tax=Limulus polyphemus TaxID=6850 RepID=A0ABM1BE08_LIMPO|nr:uncharacterized protein LOC106464490 isoform X2 [Limulus polyphemus]